MERNPDMKTLARAVSRHRSGVIATWIGVLIALVAGVTSAGVAFSDTADLPDSESATAIELLGDYQPTDVVSGQIVWHSPRVSITDPSLTSIVTHMLDEVADVDGVVAVASPYAPEGAAQINLDESTAYARVQVEDGTSVQAVRDVVEQYESPDLQVEIGGTAFTEDPGAQHGAEAIGLIAALALLFAMFRSWRAALLPLLTGIAGVASSLLVVMLASHVLPIPEQSLTMAALVGLGVGIDYALFIVHRFGKALMRGRDTADAVAEALSTSGRAVIFAGLTVMLALGAMFVLGMPILTAMALCAALTVAFTVLAAVTLLPALLAAWSRGILSRRQREALEDGVAAPENHRRAAAWVRGATSKPVLVAVSSVLALGLIAAPIASIHIGRADASADPVGTPTRDYYDLMTPAFGAGVDATVVVVGAVETQRDADAFNALVADAGQLADVAAVQAALAVAGQGVAVAAIVPTTSAQARETEDIVSAVRDDLAPVAEATSDAHIYVTGVTAANMDVAQTLLSHLPAYLVVIAVLGFALLAVAFRSLAVPALGVVTNLLSIAAGLGAAVAIFQFGWGAGLFGLGGGAPVVYVIPVLVAGVVFGLAMDYQVFLVSRMHEEWEATGSHARAVRVGTQETAQVIATAALIMVSVFASFAFAGDRIISALGVALAISVLADAFVVRLTLIPALMRLLGSRTWSYPEWAERITPRLSVEGQAHDLDEDIPVPAFARLPRADEEDEWR